MIPVLIKGLEAAAPIAGNRIVAFNGVGAKVATATAATDKLAGVSDRMGAQTGGLVDTIQVGLGDVQLGGTVAAGDLATSDAQGRAVKAMPVAGSQVRTIGEFQDAGVSGDIVPILVVPGVISTPA